MRVPAGALEIAQLLLGLGQRRFARRPFPRDHQRAVVEELQLDAVGVAAFVDARVDPRVIFAHAPDANGLAHCRPNRLEVGEAEAADAAAAAAAGFEEAPAGAEPADEAVALPPPDDWPA